MSTRWNRPDERGTGLLEVVLTVSLFLVVLTALVETHTSFLFASTKQHRAIETRSVERLAANELTTTVRSAETIWAPSGAAAAREELTMTVPVRAGTGSVVVRLRRDLGAGQVLRETLTAPGGTVVDSRVVAAGVVDAGDPFVRYFDAAGTELDPALVIPATLVGCVMRVELDVSIQPEATRPPVRTRLDVTPRNRRAEELSC